MTTTPTPDTPSLAPGCNEFVCAKCGHHVGDPTHTNWSGRCPECNRLTRFIRVELIRGEYDRSRDIPPI